LNAFKNNLKSESFLDDAENVANNANTSRTYFLFFACWKYLEKQRAHKLRYNMMSRTLLILKILKMLV
jgi:hypothetical protein